jgi:multiple sugar transport system substrate-binding protein
MSSAGILLAACSSSHPQAAATAPPTPATGAAQTSAPAASPTAASSQTTPQAQATGSKGPVEIVYSTWWAAMMDNIQPVFPKFTEKTNIKIKVEIVPYNDFVTKLTTQLTAGTAPDTMNANNLAHVKFFDSNVFLDMTERLRADKIDLKADYGLMGLEYWCGKQFALPFDNDPRAVYYNKTMIKEAGAKDPWDDLKGQWTLDDMREIAIKCTKRTANKTDQWGITMGYTGMSESNGMFVWSFGGKWADFNTMKYTLDSPESIAAHNYVYEMVMEDKSVITNAESQALTQAGISDPFSGGKVAMWIRASAQVGPLNRAVANKFEWDVAPFPGKTSGTPGITLVSGNPNEVSAKSAHADEGYQFIKWLAGEEVQGLFATNKYEVPSMNKLKATYAKPPPEHISVFPDVYKGAYGIHFRHYNTLQNYSTYSTEMEKVFLGQAKMEGTLKKLNADLNNNIKYGSCMPYAGMQVPIRPA